MIGKQYKIRVYDGHQFRTYVIIRRALTYTVLYKGETVSRGHRTLAEAKSVAMWHCPFNHWE